MSLCSRTVIRTRASGNTARSRSRISSLSCPPVYGMPEKRSCVRTGTSASAGAPATSGKAGEGGEAEIAIRALGGWSVTIRRGSSDAEVVWETFSGKFHLPPSDLWPRTIWDLGANIGLTVAHFAVLYPEARLIGVELDDGNLE